jgi:pSer/pThr/pTyr-binding forkhead associated (FHA) protein
MQAVLVMFRNDGERRSFSISRDMMVIGRRQDCDLMIPLGEISRKHCRIIREGDTLRIEDLGSSNGTFHNGRRIQEAVLEPGDTVQVGPVSFVVQIDGVPEDDEIQPNLKSAGVTMGDDDELGALSDDEELEPAPTRGAASDDDLDTLGDELTAGDNDLESLGVDEDTPKPRRGGVPADDEELEVLSEDTGGGPGLDLDAEISENLALDDDNDDSNKLDSLTDSEAGEITLDEKPKRRK